MNISNPVQQLFAQMSQKQRDRFVAEHETRLRALPGTMTPTPLPPDMADKVLGAWQSQDYSAIAWPAPNPSMACRLSINRTHINPKTGEWLAGISWDVMYRIKNECGFADFDAIEIYPAVDKLVNVANMRHLWVMQQRIPFGL